MQKTTKGHMVTKALPLQTRKLRATGKVTLHTNKASKPL